MVVLTKEMKANWSFVSIASLSNTAAQELSLDLVMSAPFIG